MKVITVIGQTYALRSKSGGDLTNEAGDVLETLSPGVQIHVTAQEPAWVLPEDCQVTACRTFKNASLALRLLGGGKSGLPAGYTRVDFLESTGAQYIDTGIVPNMDTGLSVEVSTKANVDYIPLGMRDGNGDSRFTAVRRRIGAILSSSVGYGWGQWHVLQVSEGEEITRTHYVSAMNWLFSGEASFFDKTIGDSATKPLNTTELTLHYPLFMFASNTQGNAAYHLVGQLYNAGITVGQSLVGDYKPALDPTGTPCMFDLVTRKPFYNNGTGDFLYPGKEEQATTYSLRRPRMYAQMTEHGIRRLYHVPRGYNGTPEEYAEEHGFKLLIETPAPEEGYWAPVWHEREDCIELEWVETEPPAEEALSNIEA